MSITDELRKWAEDNTLQDTVLTTYPPQHAVHGVLETLLRIADRIDAEHQKAIRELNNLAEASVLLPVDADGERWHIGDRTESGQTVEAMGLNRYGWHFVGTINEIDPAIHRHHHAPTVEDVLTEMVAKIIERGELTNGAAQTIAEYAKRLTLAEGEDE